MAGLQTRWHHLSDKELLSYRDTLPRTTTGVNVEPAMAEELFNRLEAHMDEETGRVAELNDEIRNAEDENSDLNKENCKLTLRITELEAKLASQKAVKKDDA